MTFSPSTVYKNGQSHCDITHLFMNTVWLVSLSAPSRGDQWLRRETSVYLPNRRWANNVCLLNFSHQCYDCFYSIYITFSQMSAALLAGSTNTFLTILLQYKFSLFFVILQPFLVTPAGQTIECRLLAPLSWPLFYFETLKLCPPSRVWINRRGRTAYSITSQWHQSSSKGLDGSLTVTVGAANAKLKSRGREQTSCLGRM